MKICKGTGHAKGHGCGKEIPFMKCMTNKIYLSKYGLGIKFRGQGCGCYEIWVKKNIHKPLTGISKKRAKENRVYLKKREDYLKENPYCEVMECLNKSTQVHHKKGRTGDLLIDETHFLAVCYPCHEKIEKKPEWAKNNGYSLIRTD